MNILIPMDFTEVSLNGMSYALSRFPNDQFTILHVLSGLVEVNQVYSVSSGLTPDARIRSEMEEMIHEHLHVQELPENINIEIYYGEPVNVVSNYLKNHSYDAVVLGSRDKYNIFDRLFGSTSLGIVKRSKEPIYVIPRFSKFKGYKKIMVASDEHINNKEIILALNYWNNTNAQIKFLHVHEGKDDSFTQTKEVLLDSLYEQYQPPFSYEIEEVKGDNLVDSLLANSYNYKADLLIVIARNATFLQSLVYKSVSKELIMKSAIPVLFLHTAKT